VRAGLRDQFLLPPKAIEVPEKAGFSPGCQILNICYIRTIFLAGIEMGQSVTMILSKVEPVCQV
jgi:hypothetical protein